jgi:2-hydroxycyclohexanecarboxyl-CoA dehydrogenase
MSLQGFEGRVALVTGGASGIGRSVAETLVEQGARVAACDISSPDVPRALNCPMDVTDPESVTAGVRHAEAELGPISVLVTSAGVFTPVPFAQLELGEWQRTLDVNITGTYACARAILPGMCERRYGRIVTVSSMAGLDGGTEACAHYAASKGAVIAFTKALSKEHCHLGVTANVVAPRNIRTPMVAGLSDEELMPPIGRIGEPEDVAAAVAFLSSAHAGYITGEVLVLNGGWW